MGGFKEIETIEKYLFDTLDEKTLLAFEKAMIEDKELKEEVLLHKDILTGIITYGDNKLANAIELAEINLEEKSFFEQFDDLPKEELLDGIRISGDKKFKTELKEVEAKISKEGFFQKNSEPKQTTTTLVRNILAIAASLIIGLFTFANLQFSNKNLTNIYLDKMGFYEKNIARSEDNIAKDPFLEGIAALQRQDFIKASSFFESVLKGDDKYTQARLYLAYANHKEASYNTSMQNAQIVIDESPNLINKQKAEWIIIQNILATGDLENTEFKILLNKITSDNQHLFQQEAKKLDKSINSFWRLLVI